MDQKQTFWLTIRSIPPNQKNSKEWIQSSREEKYTWPFYQPKLPFAGSILYHLFHRKPKAFCHCFSYSSPCHRQGIGSGINPGCCWYFWQQSQSHQQEHNCCKSQSCCFSPDISWKKQIHRIQILGTKYRRLLCRCFIFCWRVGILQGYFPLAIEFTRANSRREVKMKIVLTMNQMSMNLINWTLETLSFTFLCKFMKVNQLAVP